MMDSGRRDALQDRQISCSPATFPWLSWPGRRRFMVSTSVAGPTDPTATGLFHALAAVWRRCPVPSPIPALPAAISDACRVALRRHSPRHSKAHRAACVGRWCVFAIDPYPATFTPNASTGRPSGGGFDFGRRLGRGILGGRTWRTSRRPSTPRSRLRALAEFEHAPILDRSV